MPAEKDANVDDSPLNPDTVQISVAGMEETPHVGTEAGSYCLRVDREVFPWGISSGFQLWCPPRALGPVCALCSSPMCWGLATSPEGDGRGTRKEAPGKHRQGSSLAGAVCGLPTGVQGPGPSCYNMCIKAPSGPLSGLGARG